MKRALLVVGSLYCVALGASTSVASPADDAIAEVSKKQDDARKPLSVRTILHGEPSSLDSDYIHGLLAVPHFGGVPTLVLGKVDKIGDGVVQFLTQLRSTAEPSDVGAAIRAEVDRIHGAWREAASDGSKTAEGSWKETLSPDGKSYEIMMQWEHLDFGTESFVQAEFSATDHFVSADIKEQLIRKDAAKTPAFFGELVTGSVPAADRISFTVPAATAAAPITLPAPTDTDNHAPAPSLADGSKLPPMAPIIIAPKKTRDWRWLYALGGLCIFAAVMLMNRKQKAILERDRKEREAAAKESHD